MTRRLVLFLTPVLLLAGALPVSSAWGQSAVAVVQQIHDAAYGKCMTEGRFGAGSELQANCSCSADVAINLLSDGFKQAIADGTQASFQGQKLKGGEIERDVALLKTCPKVGAYLQQQCAADPGNPHCQILQKALEMAQ